MARAARPKKISVEDADGTAGFPESDATMQERWLSPHRQPVMTGSLADFEWAAPQ